MAGGFAITRAASGKTPRVPFKRIKERVLGLSYNLSLVFIGDARMRSLNRAYRGRDATTDILSFPLDAEHGEMFISLNASRAKARERGMTESIYLAFLFIHGLVHLKGYDHGAAMERLEKRYCAHFNIKTQ
jgi:probable rRNA maturation factor